MASVYIHTKPYSAIDYSLADGQVQSFVLYGKTLYDEGDGTAVDGWEASLMKFIHDFRLDTDDGGGLHMFILKMQQDGLLP